MIPRSLIDAAVRRHVSYVTVGAVLYRIEAVDTVKLASVGLAYLQGLREAMPEVETEAEASIRAESASAEEASERLADYRERERKRALRMHQAAISTPDGAAAYLERVRAFVLAGVTGIGEAPEAIPDAAPGVPGVEHHGSDWEPPAPLARVRLVDAPRDDSTPMAEALEAHAAADEWPLWAMDPAACAILATLIASLAGGRADVVAPFRTGSRHGGAGG